MNNEPNKFPHQASLNWRHILWVVLLYMLFFYFCSRLLPVQTQEEISYTEFKRKVSQGEVVEVTIKGSRITGRMESDKEKEPAEASEGETGTSPGDQPAPTRFKTTIPSMEDPQLLPLLERKEVVIHAEAEERTWLTTILITMLPWLLLIGFFVYSSRKFQERMGMGKGGGPFGFGKSKAKLYDKSMSDITFSDVAGLANAKKELREAVSFLKDPGKFQAIGGQLPKGVLLIGPPGVGKTLLAKATAGEADVPFFSISGSEFIEMFVGVGASRVRDMFKRAKKEAPAIIFIDELDSIGRVRGTGLGGGHDEREQTLNQILNEMDGFSPSESIMVMAATNRPDVLDPALTRPGRFDRQITLETPQKKARREILKIHTRKVPLADDVDLDSLAERTVGMTGADLRNLVNEAALLAARKDKKRVDEDDLGQARDRILMGLEREDILGEEEKKIIAYHEAGHALLTKLLPGADPLEKVTIIPRGRALGATEQIPEEDRHNLKRSYLLNRIAIMLAGREAEKIVFEDISTGAGDDLKQASQLARRMVCQWGMSERLGAVTFRQGEPHPFLGKELAEQRDYSEHTAQVIDEEIRSIIQEMEKEAETRLKKNRDKLDALADLLMDNETVTNEEIDQLLASNPDSSTNGQGFLQA